MVIHIGDWYFHPGAIALGWRGEGGLNIEVEGIGSVGECKWCYYPIETIGPGSTEWHNQH